MSALPATTRVGAVTLTVGALDRSVAYYRDAIGLAVIGEAPGSAHLGAGGEVLVRLVEEPGAQPDERSAGLFHLALLLPTRADLARWVQHAVDDRVPVGGASDHVVSEALYLTDPDGHGIEIYADRPREVWEGRVAQLMTTVALDLPSLLAEADPAQPWDGVPTGTTMGHVHLRVTDVPTTIAWYRDVLGFELMATYGPQAAFLAADGYHHHIGANTWHSAGQPIAGPGRARLASATLLLPEAADRDALADRVRAAGGTPERDGDGWRVTDPSGIVLRVA